MAKRQLKLCTVPGCGKRHTRKGAIKCAKVHEKRTKKWTKKELGL